MGSVDRPKKRGRLLKKALLHFALCFVMGFFSGFAPRSTATLFSGRRAEHLVPAAPTKAVERLVVNSTVEIPGSSSGRGQGSPHDPPPPLQVAGAGEPQSPSQRLLIVVTTTRAGDRLQDALLRRLAHTLRLVPPPLLWIVVQDHADALATAAMLRTTGVMYRHLTFKENFTDPAVEADHQRNVALSHVEYHRLSGIVHFAGASNVYDLQFFDKIREIEYDPFFPFPFSLLPLWVISSIPPILLPFARE
ncbi:hypothetical protein BHE74_00026203 [Ensete ventricosum]|nr:hypothetical protein GW17_00042548 [Ensete ventricosum]RWW66425.1 hypothetical protein BHE74_00026203 [Ensete ventricosum]RZS28941.1 hypothetical protein BHM03_00062596 [Ensete ventricosum]